MLVALFLKISVAPTRLRTKLQRIDYIGIALFVISSVSFLVPITWGGVMYPWESFRTLLPMFIGAAGLAAFILYEVHFVANPIIQMSIFRSCTAMASYIGTAMHGLIIWCLLYYFPLYFEAVKEYNPVLAGVSLFPIILTLAPSAIVTGLLITKIGRYRWAIWLGWTLTTVGIGLLCLLKAETSVLGWVFLMLVPGLGLGILFPAIIFAVQASANPGQLSMAVAMCSFFRSFGQSIGVAIGGAIFQNRMRANLLAYPAFASHAENYSNDAAALVQIVRACPDAGMKQDLKDAYADSLRIVWAVCCALAGCAMLFSIFTQEYDLNRAMQPVQGFAREEKSESKDEEGGGTVGGPS